MLVQSDVSCASCSIVIDSIATIPGLALSAVPNVMTRDSGGSIYLTDAEGLLKVYGAGGEFIRQIGRKGGGPGEYEVIRNVLVGRDGIVHILDAQLSRHSWFSADGRFAGSRVVPVVVGGLSYPAALLPDDRLIVNQPPIAPSESGHPLVHVVDEMGRATPPFGKHPIEPMKAWLSRRLLWVRPNGEVVIGEPLRFSVDVYASDFTRKHTIRRVADWIPLEEPRDQPSDGVFDSPFTPTLLGMWEDADGLLWLLMVIPSPSWRPGPPENAIRGKSEDEYLALVRRPRTVTVLEAVDLKEERVVGRLRLDRGIGGPFGGGYFAMATEDPGGEPIVRISRARLRR